MISKVTIKEDLAIIWIPVATNLHAQVDLPTFDYGRILLERCSHKCLDENLKRNKNLNEDVGFQFYGWEQHTIKRVVDQIKILQRMSPEEFREFADNWMVNTDNTLAEVLASLDCDPWQKESYSIRTEKGPLKKLFPKKYWGFGINLLGKDFLVEVVINKGQFVWTSYQCRGVESCNFRWLKLCSEIDNAKNNQTD